MTATWKLTNYLLAFGSLFSLLFFVKRLQTTLIAVLLPFPFFTFDLILLCAGSTVIISFFYWRHNHKFMPVRYVEAVVQMSECVQEELSKFQSNMRKYDYDVITAKIDLQEVCKTMKLEIVKLSNLVEWLHQNLKGGEST